MEWDYNNKTWDVKVNGQSYDIPLGIMTDEMYDKLAGAYLGGHEEGSQRYQSLQRRKACSIFVGHVVRSSIAEQASNRIRK